MNPIKPSPVPFAVQVEPIAARLINGARTVAIETAFALRVGFGDKRTALTAAAAIGGAAQMVAAAHGPSIVTLAVPAGAEFIALALSTEGPHAASIAARQGARVVGVTVH